MSFSRDVRTTVSYILRERERERERECVKKPKQERPVNAPASSQLYPHGHGGWYVHAACNRLASPQLWCRAPLPLLEYDRRFHADMGRRWIPQGSSSPVHAWWRWSAAVPVCVPCIVSAAALHLCHQPSPTGLPPPQCHGRNFESL